MKKLFQEIISGSLRQLPAEVTAENAPEGDAKEHFKAIGKTFEIASVKKGGYAQKNHWFRNKDQFHQKNEKRAIPKKRSAAQKQRKVLSK